MFIMLFVRRYVKKLFKVFLIYSFLFLEVLESICGLVLGIKLV